MHNSLHNQLRKQQRNTLRNSLSAINIPPHLENPYMRISFWGSPRAYEKYRKLQDICERALSWLQSVDCQCINSRDKAAELAQWMRSSGGLTRPHLPYFVTLTPAQWKTLVFAVRRAGRRDTEYAWLRFYGEWV